jgi:hypothetical protein
MSPTMRVSGSVAALLLGSFTLRSEGVMLAKRRIAICGAGVAGCVAANMLEVIHIFYCTSYICYMLCCVVFS